MITPLTSVTSVPAMAPVHPPTEDDNGIIHQIAPVVIPRAPAVSSSVQQCPAVSTSVQQCPVFVMLLIIMSIVPVAVSMPVGHLGGHAVAVRVAAAPVLGSALPTRVASRSVRSLHAGHG